MKTRNQKKAVLVGPRRFELRELAVPKPALNEVRIRVDKSCGPKFGPICCYRLWPSSKNIHF
jgi:hypothetical protein